MKKEGAESIKNITIKIISKYTHIHTKFNIFIYIHTQLNK